MSQNTFTLFEKMKEILIITNDSMKNRMIIENQRENQEPRHNLPHQNENEETDSILQERIKMVETNTQRDLNRRVDDIKSDLELKIQIELGNIIEKREQNQLMNQARLGEK